ncbi:PrsW family intramembrane metalloprotease [Rosettibacter firmus]|uniref:PrsW family intramembrane metalloprotease n=1 Tax=Rosettibacter firmus TaxID=3111522 RepID=UPI00336BB341
MFLYTSLLASILPMTLYLVMLWYMDKYEREPLSYVLLHFLWGALGAIFFGALGNYLISSLVIILSKSTISSSILSNIIAAPIAEEISKALFLFYSFRSTKFDNFTDGLVYGGAIGLGFGMTENFIYFITFGTTIEILIILILLRSSFSAVMHCISTSIFGASLGMIKFSSYSLKILYPVFGILLSILIHFMWNLSVSKSETLLFGFLFMILLIILFVSIFIYSLKREKEIIINELLEETKIDIIPESHINIISSKSRFRKGWIDEQIRKKYFRTAINLAFNKVHYKNSKGTKKDFYEIEIEKNRAKLKELLSNYKSG